MKDKMQHAFTSIQMDDVLAELTVTRIQSTLQQKPKEAYKRTWTYRAMATVAAMFVLVAGVSLYNLFYVASAYVGIDVNPSVELTLNRMDRVMAVAAFNNEGQLLLEQTGLQGKKYDEASTILVAAMEAEGYLQQDALVTVTVQAATPKKEQLLEDTLLHSVGNQLRNGAAEAGIEVFAVSEEVRTTAQQCHMSAAKYLAIQELMEVDEDATLEAYSHHSIQQIREQAQSCREGHQTINGQDNSDWPGNGGMGDGCRQNNNRYGGHHNG